MNGQDALISSTPIHAPALALRETPADGALLSVFDIPPARMSALRGPTPSRPLRLAHFAPGNEGIGAAYRIAFTTRGHHVLVFVSLGDAAGRATKRAALAVLRGISADVAASRAWIRGSRRRLKRPLHLWAGHWPTLSVATSAPLGTRRLDLLAVERVEEADERFPPLIGSVQVHIVRSVGYLDQPRPWETFSHLAGGLGLDHPFPARTTNVGH